MLHKVLYLFPSALLACVTLGVQAQQLVKWEGLCIPKDRVSWLQPGGGPQFGGPFAEAMFHLKSSLPGWNIPVVGMAFSGDEFAKAIPGYLAVADYKLPDGSPIRLHLGSVVTIEPVTNDVPSHDPASIKNLENLWNMTGKWAGADVARLSGSPYYKVIRKGDAFDKLSFSLIKVNLQTQRKDAVAFEPLSKWYIGTCGINDPGVPSMGFRCERVLIGKTFRIHYSVEGRDINFIDQIDQFMEAHIRKWAANCARR